MAISRAAGPDVAQNTSGATSNKTARPGHRRARLRHPWAGAGPGRASRGSSTTHSDTSAAGVEGAGGSGGPGRASRSTPPSRRLACGDLAGGRARRRPEHQRCHKQQNSKARVRRARLRHPWAAAGPGRASRGSSTTHSDTSAAGAEGAGGCGGPGRASRSTTPSQRLACGDLAGSRTRRRPEHQRRHQQHRTPDAIGMEVTGGHTKQPGHAAGPDGARNTSGAAKQPGPDTRKPRPADAGRGQPTQSGGKV